MVLQEAVKSLGDIGKNDNDDALRMITWVVSSFDTLNPDNILAIATIDAFEKLAKTRDGGLPSDAIRLLMRFSEGAYIRPVQERARQLLADLRGY